MKKKNSMNRLLKGIIVITCTGFILNISGLGGVRPVRADDASNDNVSGQVTDTNTGWPLYASIAISGTGYSGETIWTNPYTGDYTASLPEGIAFNFRVTAWVQGYSPSDTAVGPLTDDLANENIGLAADLSACNAPGLISTGFAEDFESAAPPDLPVNWAETIAFGTDGNWATNAGTVNPGGIPAHGGSNLAYFNSSDSGNRARVRLYRTTSINMTTVSGTTLTFWMYHDTEYPASNDRVEVQISTDAGQTWSNVGDVISRFDGSTGWEQHSIDLSTFADQTDLRLGFLGVSELVRDGKGNIIYHGNDIHIDDIALGTPSCEAQAGGLVVGTVYNDTSNNPLNGVTVSSGGGYSTITATTGDPSMGDGFYSLFLPAGFHTLSAALSGDSYSSSTADVDVTLNEVVQQDFHLVSPSISFDPADLQVTIPIGSKVTIPFTLTNDGGYHASYKLQEGNGFATAELSGATLGGVKGEGTWLSRADKGIPLQSNEDGTVVAYPSTYRWTPAAASSVNVLLYADDLIYSPPNTYPDQALQALGIAYTAHYNGDFTGFEADLASGKWSAVLYEGDNYTTPATTLAALNSYVQGGGKLGIEIWDLLNNNSDPLFTTLGVAFAGNYIDPSLATYWWNPTSPIFANPDRAPEWPSYSCSATRSCGQYVDPVTGVSTALGGYTATPTAGQAALIAGTNGNTVFKAFSDRPNTGTDANKDGIKDVVALWANITDYLLSSNFPWLSASPGTGNISADSSKPVDISFDASKVTKPGIYNGRLYIYSNDPINRYDSVPVTMTVKTVNIYLPLIMK